MGRHISSMVYITIKFCLFKKRLLEKYDFTIKDSEFGILWLLEYHSRPCFIHEETEAEGSYDFSEGMQLVVELVLCTGQLLFQDPFLYFERIRVHPYIPSNILYTLHMLTGFILQQHYKIVINCPHLPVKKPWDRDIGWFPQGHPVRGNLDPKSRVFNNSVTLPLIY